MHALNAWCALGQPPSTNDVNRHMVAGDFNAHTGGSSELGILPHPTMALIGSTWLYYILPWLYLTLLHSTMATLLYLTLLQSAIACSSWFYLTPLYTLSWLYLALLDSTTLYHDTT